MAAPSGTACAGGEAAAFAAAHADSILLVFDVETDGPDVRANSMFAFGGVAIEVATKRILGAIKYHVREREGATKAAKTMEFWSAPAQADMYAALHVDAVSEAEAAGGVAAWLSALKAEYPLARFTFASDCLPFDMRWMDAALTTHVAPFLLGYSGLDIYSYAAGAFKVPRAKAWDAIEALKKEGILGTDVGILHTHDPLDDATYEAALAVDVMRACRGLAWTPLAWACTPLHRNKPNTSTVASAKYKAAWTDADTLAAEIDAHVATTRTKIENKGAAAWTVEAFMAAHATASASDGIRYVQHMMATRGEVWTSLSRCPSLWVSDAANMSLAAVDPKCVRACVLHSSETGTLSDGKGTDKGKGEPVWLLSDTDMGIRRFDGARFAQWPAGTRMLVRGYAFPLRDQSIWPTLNMWGYSIVWPRVAEDSASKEGKDELAATTLTAHGVIVNNHMVRNDWMSMPAWTFPTGEKGDSKEATVPLVGPLDGPPCSLVAADGSDIVVT